MISRVVFPCPECGQQIDEEIYVPEPNYAAEGSRDSVVEHEEYVTCPSCDKEHAVEVYNSFGGLDVTVRGVECKDLHYDQPAFEEPDYEEDQSWYYETPYSQYYDFFKCSAREIENMLKVDVKNESLNGVLLRLLFVQVVTILETYLGDTLKALTLQYNVNLIKLLEFDEEMKKTKISLDRKSVV